MKVTQSSGSRLFQLSEIIEILYAYDIDVSRELGFTSHLLTKVKINTNTKNEEDLNCVDEASKYLCHKDYRFGCILNSGNTSRTLYPTYAGVSLRDDIIHVTRNQLQPTEVWPMMKDLSVVLKRYSDIGLFDVLKFLTVYDDTISSGKYRIDETHFTQLESMARYKRGPIRKAHYIGEAPKRAGYPVVYGDIIKHKGDNFVKALLEVHKKHYKEGN